MQITEDDIFTFYFKNSDNEIERKELLFDFNIKEENRETIELVSYQKNITEEISHNHNFYHHIVNNKQEVNLLDTNSLFLLVLLIAV